MVLVAGQKWPFVINLGNSIIGVAVLAMPFCFRQCGLLLGMLVLLFCTWLTLASCQLLVKAGIMSHYQSYEYLAYHTYGGAGKFLVEMGMIGMQLGTLVAQIVVIGDLGPPIISHLFGLELQSTGRTRTYLIITMCLLVGLPLGLMKDLRNVSRASTICIMFYAVFVVYSLWLASGNLWKGEWLEHVNMWRPQGFFQCLPIISFSFGCQTQLFIMYDALPEPSLQAIKGIIHSAVSLCAVAYLLVGFFGYVSFYHLDIPGDVITVFPSSLGTHLIKLGFVLSIAITFPVIIFPCRASIYTLLFQKRSKHSDLVASSYIPEHLFKGITIAIVVGSMITGILIPNVEFVLGLNGAITGTLICYIFPALFFLRVSKPEGKLIAQIVLVFGVAIMLISTFTTLHAQDKSHATDEVQKAVQAAADRVGVQFKDLPQDRLGNNKEAVPGKPKENAHEGNANGRLEPPYPFAPADDKEADSKAKQNEKHAPVVQDAAKEAVAQKVEKELQDEKNPDLGKKDVKSEKKEGGEKREQMKEQLLDALAVQQQKQEELLKQQKALLQELKEDKPNKQNAAGPQQGGEVKQSENKVNQLPVVKRHQSLANQPPAVAQQGQDRVNPVVAQGQDAVNPVVAQGDKHPAAAQEKQVVNNPPVVPQAANNVNQPQAGAPNSNAAGQPQVLAPQQNVGNQPQAVAQGQDKAHQPQAVIQDQGIKNPPQGVAQPGPQQVNQPEAVQQNQAGPAVQQAPELQQGGAGLPAQGNPQQDQGRPAEQQGQAGFPAQENQQQQNPGQPPQQQAAGLQPDKAILAPRQRAFQDRDILEDQAEHADRQQGQGLN